MTRYEQIIKDVEEKFLEPKYLEHKIHYVSNKHAAEISISNRHTMGDYLLVGIRALQRSLNGVSGDILVFNDPSPATKIIGIPVCRYSSLCKVSVNSEIFVQSYIAIKEILKKLYKADIPKEISFSDIGVTISNSLMFEFSDADSGIPQEIMSELQFTHFDDVRTAEENTFLIIKKMTAPFIASVQYAADNGKD